MSLYSFNKNYINDRTLSKTLNNDKIILFYMTSCPGALPFLSIFSGQCKCEEDASAKHTSHFPKIT